LCHLLVPSFLTSAASEQRFIIFTRALPLAHSPDNLRAMSGTGLSKHDTPLPHQQRLIGPLLEMKDPQRRLARLVEEARKRPALTPAMRTESHRVEGCLVRVWFVPEFRAGRCFFHCDSDAVSLKAVGGLLCDLHSGHTAEEITRTGPGVLQPLGLLHQLAENRQRTLARIEEKIHAFARARLTNPE
jgi:cysteine desulfuration protein SufE